MLPRCLQGVMVATPVLLGVFILACSRAPRTGQHRPTGDPRIACTLVDWPSVIAELRDPSGRAVARGATLELRGEGFHDRTPATQAFDSLRLGAGHRSAGVFNVRASKPGYVSAETSGVSVPGGPCGARARVTVPLTLRPRRFSPRVRSIVIFGSGFGLGPGVYHATVTAYVNAADGVDTTVDWRSSNTRAVTVDRQGNITSRCLKRKATAIVTATSRADPQKQARTPVDVFGDPTMCAAGDR